MRKINLFFICLFLGAARGVFSAEPSLALDEDASYAFGVLLAFQIREAENVSLDASRFADGFCDYLTGEGAVSYESALSSMMRLAMDENVAAILDSDMSYACGIVIASQIKESDMVMSLIVLNKARFKDGFTTALAGDAGLDARAAVELLEPLFQEAGERQLRQNREAGERFLAENALKTGVSTTGSGLQYQVQNAGSGKKPDKESLVTVNYEGRLIDGVVFDSSYERGEPAQFLLEDVIPGWTEGIQLISPGGKITLYIPPNLGYGSRAAGAIPPNSVLVFDVELIAVE